MVEMGAKDLQIVVAEFIVAYIKDHVDGSVPVTKKSNFIKDGLLDSFATLSLIMSLEAEFGVKFIPQELADSSLQVIENMADVIVAKVRAGKG